MIEIRSGTNSTDNGCTSKYSSNIVSNHAKPNNLQVKNALKPKAS